MTWAQWILGYVLAGFVVVILVRLQERRWQEVTDVLSAVFCWPITLLSWFPYKIGRWRRERARQARIAALVNEGELTEEQALTLYHWNGKR
jgi:amino acid permease